MNLSIEILGATQDELKSLSEKLPKAGKLSFRPQKDSLLFWKWRGFQVAGVADGLETANPKSEYWMLDAETTKNLTEILAGFYKISPRRFTLYAAVSGDLPKRETEVQLDELLELIQGKQLGNRVKYQVRPQAVVIPRATGEDEEAAEQQEA